MKTTTFQRFFLGTVVSLFIFSLAAAGHAAEYVSVIKDGVNIRSGPSTTNKVVWQVFRSFPLEVIKREGKWVNVVDFEGDKGWIYETLISSKKTVIVNVETANMRAGSSTDDPVIATVKKGVVFEPLEMIGDWMKVRYKNEITGWMHNSLLWPSNPL
ncbi:MAG: peptide-binding protein [Desulfobacterales bacterium SG8_35]|nr:MAG: peptide-binding protein [Desulfobacterales bacterium SG8_35]